MHRPGSRPALIAGACLAALMAGAAGPAAFAQQGADAERGALASWPDETRLEIELRLAAAGFGAEGPDLPDAAVRAFEREILRNEDGRLDEADLGVLRGLTRPVLDQWGLAPVEIEPGARLHVPLGLDLERRDEEWGARFATADGSLVILAARRQGDLAAIELIDRDRFGEALTDATGGPGWFGLEGRGGGRVYVERFAATPDGALGFTVSYDPEGPVAGARLADAMAVLLLAEAEGGRPAEPVEAEEPALAAAGDDPAVPPDAEPREPRIPPGAVVIGRLIPPGEPMTEEPAGQLEGRQVVGRLIPPGDPTPQPEPAEAAPAARAEPGDTGSTLSGAGSGDPVVDLGDPPAVRAPETPAEPDGIDAAQAPVDAPPVEPPPADVASAEAPPELPPADRAPAEIDTTEAPPADRVPAEVDTAETPPEDMPPAQRDLAESPPEPAPTGAAEADPRSTPPESPPVEVGEAGPAGPSADRTDDAAENGGSDEAIAELPTPRYPPAQPRLGAPAAETDQPDPREDEARAAAAGAAETSAAADAAPPRVPASDPGEEALAGTADRSSGVAPGASDLAGSDQPEPADATTSATSSSADTETAALSLPEQADRGGTGRASAGVFVANGVILTNAEPLAGCREVALSGAFTGAGAVTARDPDRDLALVRVTGIAPGIARLNFAAPNSGTVRLYRAGEGGDLGRLEGSIAFEGAGRDWRFLEVRLPEAEGVGGPLLDHAGNLVAMVPVSGPAPGTASLEPATDGRLALKASLVASFLDANNVRFMLGSAISALPSSEVEAAARSYSVVVRCAEGDDAG